MVYELRHGNFYNVQKSYVRHRSSPRFLLCTLLLWVCHLMICKELAKKLKFIILRKNRKIWKFSKFEKAIFGHFQMAIPSRLGWVIVIYLYCWKALGMIFIKVPILHNYGIVWRKYSFGWRVQFWILVRTNLSLRPYIS